MLGFSEIVLIMVVALLVLGPKKLPEVARTLGRAVGTFRRTLDEFQGDFNSHLDFSSPPSPREREIGAVQHNPKNASEEAERRTANESQ